MKIQVLGHEITDAELSFVSLVKRGANMSPFKIIKTEDLPDEDDEENKTLMDRVKVMLSNVDTSKRATIDVAAFFVAEAMAKAVKPILEASGFKTDDIDIQDGVVIMKQAAYDPEKGIGTLIALTKDVGLGLTRHISKEFHAYPESTDFDENVKASAFFPGLHNALDSLMGTIFNQLDAVDNPGDASSEISKTLSSFSIHIENLVGNLPQSVFKAEQALRSLHGGSKVENIGTQTGISKTGDDKMKLLPEAAAGDLDGLNDPVQIKKDAEALAAGDAAIEAQVAAEKLKEGDEVAAEVVKTAEELKAESDAAAGEGDGEGSPEVKIAKTLRDVDGTMIEAEYQYTENEDGSHKIIKWVEKTEADDEAPAWAKGLITEVASLKAEIEKVQKEPVKKTDAPVRRKVVIHTRPEPADESLASLTGDIGRGLRKAEDDSPENVWGGSALDVFDGLK